jgi:hypothetical protein
MNIDRRLNGHDLLSDDFYIAAPTKAEVFKTVKRPRIGVDYAKHWARAAPAILHQGATPTFRALDSANKKRDLVWPGPAWKV